MKAMAVVKKIFCFFFVLFALFGLKQQFRMEKTVFFPTRTPNSVLIIDAGHGGEDGGAVSNSGTIESHINLEIALRVAALSDLYGIHHVLLRDSDCSLHDDTCNTLREKKVSDLRNRVNMIENTENAVLLSIHQNTFSNQRYRGAQVFYGTHEDSLSYAKIVQSILHSKIDPENTRVPAKIPSSVYLMNHITCPAILVECGFLSNPEEDTLLNTKEYQTKIALALTASYIHYQETTEGETLYESS